MIILDTDIMIDLLRGYPPALKWLQALEDTPILLPGFVVMELIQGCRNKKEQTQLEKKLFKFKIIWPTEKSCHNALEVFSKYHLSHGIGIIDALIGQLAVDLDLPLYTFNEKHYLPIPNLKMVKPYQKTAQ